MSPKEGAKRREFITPLGRAAAFGARAAGGEAGRVAQGDRMASVNCGAPIATRAQAEKLLDEYFALVEQAVARPSAKRFAQY
jgi:hypothetical protein